MLISFAFTVKLICAFVFAYADCWFSHAAAHIHISPEYLLYYYLPVFMMGEIQFLASISQEMLVIFVSDCNFSFIEHVLVAFMHLSFITMPTHAPPLTGKG